MSACHDEVYELLKVGQSDVFFNARTFYINSATYGMCDQSINPSPCHRQKQKLQTKSQKDRLMFFAAKNYTFFHIITMSMSYAHKTNDKDLIARG